MVSSWWEPSQAGPARRTYVLTEQGRKGLNESVQSLRDVREILVTLLDRYDTPVHQGFSFPPLKHARSERCDPIRVRDREADALWR